MNGSKGIRVKWWVADRATAEPGDFSRMAGKLGPVLAEKWCPVEGLTTGSGALLIHVGIIAFLVTRSAPSATVRLYRVIMRPGGYASDFRKSTM